MIPSPCYCKYGRHNLTLRSIKNLPEIVKDAISLYSDISSKNAHLQAKKTSNSNNNNETNQETKNKNQERSKENKKYPQEPTTCCMSGCANCVWLEYAEKLSEYYRDGGEQALKEINEKVTDPNIKAFLLHEMRMRMKKK